MSRTKKPAAPFVKPPSDAVYAYTPAQIAEGVKRTEMMRKEYAAGRRVNKQAGDLRVRRVMDKTLLFNAIAAGEDPRHDETYVKDMVKRGNIVEVPVASESITARPLSARGRANFERIFGERKPSFTLAEVAV